MMIGLSIAVARFVEALLWAILRGAGVVTVAVLAGVAGLIAVALLVRRAMRRRR